MTAPAICKCMCAPASSKKLLRPAEMGRQSGLLVTSIGQARAFHEPMKVNRITVINAALERGNTIWMR